MVLKWEAKWGYSDNSLDNKLDLNSVHYLDESYYTIPQYLSWDPDTTNHPFSIANASYIHDLFLTDLINATNYENGEVTTLFSFVSSNFIDKTISYFNGINKYQKNLCYYLKTTTTPAPATICCIPSLNRIIGTNRSNVSGKAYGRIYIYDLNGIIIDKKPGFSYSNSSSVDGYFFYIGKTDLLEDIISPENYKFLGIGSQDKYYVNSYTKSNNDYYNDFSTFLINMYGDYKPPIKEDNPSGGSTDTPPQPNLPVVTPGENGIPGLTGDSIPCPNIATWISLTGTRLVTIFNPTLSQLNELAERMHSSDFTDALLNWWQGNPAEVIISLHVVPFSVPNGITQHVYMWNFDTGIEMQTAGLELVNLDCGSVTISYKYNSFLDYAPFTEVQMYIPYVGYVNLNTDDVMGATIQLCYQCDAVSGTGVALLKVNNTLLYQYPCQFARQIPFTAASADALIKAGIDLVVSVGSMIAGGIAGSAASSSLVSAGAKDYQIAMNNMYSMRQTLSSAGTVVSSAPFVSGAKPHFMNGGVVTAASGQLGSQIPFVVIRRPVANYPFNYNTHYAFPTMKGGTLSDYSGFVKVGAIKMDGIACTDWELGEIYQLLKEGVYI